MRRPRPAAWLAIGVAVGAAIYVATRNPVWIAVGVAIGAALATRTCGERR